MDRKLLQTIKKEFSNLFENTPELLGIILFGSQVQGDVSEQSDVDICLVLPDFRNGKRILSKFLKEFGDKYDVWLWDELPIHILSEIIDNYTIVISKDEHLMKEYFYPFRKKIEEFRHRLKVAYGKL